MDQVDFLLTRRVDKIYPSREELEKVLRSGKKLRLYQGFDPSSPVLHIGHLAGLKKLADFQKAGHEVIFLIGDFTGMIGDPTGKGSGRQLLTHEQVLKNADEYKKQAGRVLKFNQEDCTGGEQPVKIMFNYDWSIKLTFADLIKIASNVTAQNMWERDMFQERVKRGQEVWLHELLYPLAQGYDSVAMDVDLEIGGTDQMFNMMVGRELMRKIKNKNKFVLTTPLLTDKNGRKIGKTEGNAIAIADPPAKLFVNMMTLPDDVIIPAFELITDVPQEEIDNYKKQLVGGDNPMNLKKLLAFTVVKELNNDDAAKQAQEEFARAVQGGEVPENILEVKVENNVTVSDVVSTQVVSRNEAKRLIEQGAVEINGKVVKDQKLVIGKNSVVKIGKKKFIKIV